MICSARAVITVALVALAVQWPTAAAAQRAVLRVHAGAAAASPLLRHEVASPALRQLLGGDLDSDARLEAAPAAVIGAGVRVALRPHVAADIGVHWTPTWLRVREGPGERRLQDLHVIDAAAVVTGALGPRMEAGGGPVVVAHLTARDGVFRDGSRLSPGVVGTLGWTPPLANGRFGVVGRLQLVRFGTAAAREAGAADGTVTRAAVLVRIRLLDLVR